MPLRDAPAFRDSVRRFSGEIILDSLSIVWTLDSLDDFFYRLACYTDIDYGAYLHGHYFFREDTTVHGAGLLQGRVIYSVIHEKGTLCYDPEGIDYADGYDNNQYQGTWSLSDGTRSVPCNWGHFRIPNSQRLDSGVGEFNPDSQYVNNGWQLHHLLLNAVYGTPQYDSIHAQYEADRNWWCK